MRVIRENEILSAVGIQDAVLAMEALFREGVDGDTTASRHVMPVPGTAGMTLFMPALHAGRETLGIKVSSIRPRNHTLPAINGAYLLVDYRSGTPLAAIECNAITRLRTAAVSALVTRELCGIGRRQRVALLGTGEQALAHAQALCTILPVDMLSFMSRSPRRTEAFHDLLCEQTWAPLQLRPSHSLDELLDGASVLCTCTSTSIAYPLLHGGDLPSSIRHINAIGGSTLEAMELDPRIYLGTSVIVETREAAQSDAADLRSAITQGLVDPERMLSVSDLLRNGAPLHGARSIYRSVGHAMEDLALAELIWREAGGHG